MRAARRFIVAVLLLLAMHTAAERINQEGRILGVLPVVTNAVLFNTTNADAVLSAMDQEAAADRRRAFHLAISAFCFPNFNFSARPPAPLPPKP